MRREWAETMTTALLTCSGMLDESVSEVQASEEQNFFQQYRSSVGTLMGLFYFDILRVIFKKYPDLEPESWK